MSTVTIWLLVSVGNGYFGAGAQPSFTVERFVSASDCEATRSRLFATYETKPRLACVEAKVYKP